MSKYAIICGDAPEDYRMKKTEEMFDFLQTKEGGSLSGSNIISFPNGVSELFLEATLNRCINEETKSILLYICTKESVRDSEETFFIGGEEIQKSVIAHYQKQAKDVGFDFQVIYDVCHDFINEDDLGYEKV